MMPAGVSGAGLRVDMGVFVYDEGVQFSDDGDSWAWSAASRYSARYTGESQAVLVGNPHFGELLGYQF